MQTAQQKWEELINVAVSPLQQTESWEGERKVAPAADIYPTFLEALAGQCRTEGLQGSKVPFPSVLWANRL